MGYTPPLPPPSEEKKKKNEHDTLMSDLQQRVKYAREQGRDFIRLTEDEWIVFTVFADPYQILPSDITPEKVRCYGLKIVVGEKEF